MKKFLTSILVVGMLLGSANSAFANETETTTNEDTVAIGTFSITSDPGGGVKP